MVVCGASEYVIHNYHLSWYNRVLISIDSSNESFHSKFIPGDEYLHCMCGRIFPYTINLAVHIPKHH